MPSRSGKPRPPHLFPLGATIGRDNLVLHASAQRHTVQEFEGPLSIKSVIRGRAAWIVAGRELVVDDTTFLILNPGERYSMNLDSLDPIETCCSFFCPQFVERVARDMTTSLARALEDPLKEAPALPFEARLHRDETGTILPRLRSLAERCTQELQPSSFEEDFLILAQALSRVHEDVVARIARVPAARASTRAELFRRLERAREFLHSESEAGLSLERAASEACLSPYHLHRSFKHTYGTTPHDYLTELRMNRARALLRSGESVTETSLAVGFTSVSAFSRVFRARLGVSPSSQIRKIGQAVR